MRFDPRSVTFRTVESLRSLALQSASPPVQRSLEKGGRGGGGWSPEVEPYLGLRASNQNSEGI